MHTYKATLVANAFLHKAMQSRADVTHMKLQKLVFFAHAWGLALNGASPVAERPEAWQHGPVFETVYHALKGVGTGAVSDPIESFDPVDGCLKGLVPNIGDRVFWGLVDQVWERYGAFSGLQLSALAHEPGGPWARARAAQWLDLNDGHVIEHFRGKLSDAQPINRAPMGRGA